MNQLKDQKLEDNMGVLIKEFNFNNFQSVFYINSLCARHLLFYFKNTNLKFSFENNFDVFFILRPIEIILYPVTGSSFHKSLKANNSFRYSIQTASSKNDDCGLAISVQKITFLLYFKIKCHPLWVDVEYLTHIRNIRKNIPGILRKKNDIAFSRADTFKL